MLKLKENDVPGNVASGKSVCRRCLLAAVRYEIRRHRPMQRYRMDLDHKQLTIELPSWIG